MRRAVPARPHPDKILRKNRRSEREIQLATDRVSHVRVGKIAFHRHPYRDFHYGRTGRVGTDCDYPVGRRIPGCECFETDIDRLASLGAYFTAE